LATATFGLMVIGGTFRQPGTSSVETMPHRHAHRMPHSPLPIFRIFRSRITREAVCEARSPSARGGGLGATAGPLATASRWTSSAGSVTRSPCLAGMSPPKELARRSSEARPASAHYAALPDLIRGPRLPSDMRFRDRSPEDRRRMIRALTGALHTPCAPRERSIPLGRFAGATPAEDEAQVERDDVGVRMGREGMRA